MVFTVLNICSKANILHEYLFLSEITAKIIDSQTANYIYLQHRQSFYTGQAVLLLTTEKGTLVEMYLSGMVEVEGPAFIASC